MASGAVEASTVARRSQVPLGQHKDFIDQLVVQAAREIRHRREYGPVDVLGYGHDLTNIDDTRTSDGSQTV